MKAMLRVPWKVRALVAVIAILGAAVGTTLLVVRGVRAPDDATGPAMWRDRRSTPDERRASYTDVLRKLQKSPTLEIRFTPWMSAEVEARARLEGEHSLAVHCVLDPNVLQMYLGARPTGLWRGPFWGERASILLIDTDGDSECDRFRQPAEVPASTRLAEGSAPVQGTGLGVLWDAALEKLGAH
jgi:hypothetical protein